MAVDTETTALVAPVDADTRPDRGSERAATSLMDVLRLRPGWPLVMLFLGYPIWWALGLTELMSIVAAIAMAWELGRTRTIRVPPGFGWWLLFLMWVVLSVALVQINAPGAVAGSSSTRYVTWAWRLLWYLKATVVLLYLGNMRRRLSLTWVCRLFGWMFVFIVAGGLLGVVAPNFEFHSLAELLLPKGVSSNAFIFAKIHPVAAEVHVGFLDSAGRTSAPFPYANVWGLNFACFLPFFVVAWFGRDAGWRRVAGPIVLAVAAVPVVFSLNRGLWAALLTAAVFVAVRSAIAGRARPLAAFAIGAVVVAFAILFSPLGNTIDNRLNGDGPSSNQGRDNLSSLGLSTMAKTSPILGFGTTRDVQGNFDSIAGGSTTQCPRCSLPPLGTQGQFSLVTFTQGIVGAILYFGFLLLQFLRYVRMRIGYAMTAMAVLIVHFVTAAVYGADNLAILAILGAVALVWRAKVHEDLDEDPERLYAPGEPTIHSYLRTIGDRRWTLVAIALVGLLMGAAVSYSEGRTYIATVSIDVPADPVYTAQRQQATTLDTIAQYASSTSTLDAMQRAAGAGQAVKADHLAVTATPNTTILHLTYTAGSMSAARTIVTAAGQSVLAQRRDALVERKNDLVAILLAQGRALSTALITATDAARATQSASPLTSLTNDLITQAGQVNAYLVQVEQAPLDGGIITAPVTGRVIWDRWKVNLVSGFGLGLLAGVGACLLAGSRGPRLRSKRYRGTARELPVLATGSARALDATTILALENPASCVGVSERSEPLAVAADVDSHISRGSRLQVPGRVILFAGPDDRLRRIERTRHSLERAGAQVIGVVIVEQSVAGRPRA